jgi:hypothetical protein
MAFAVIEPARLPLDTPERTDPLDDAYSGFTHVADRAVAHALLRTQPLDHARGHHYQGPRRLPGPDSHRQAASNLSLYVMWFSFPHGARAVSAHSIQAEAAVLAAPGTATKRIRNARAGTSALAVLVHGGAVREARLASRASRGWSVFREHHYSRWDLD